MRPPPRLVLASTSPRRKDLLGLLGIPFEVVSPDFSEIPTDLPPEDECLLFAESKARSVRERFPDAWILGCDTLVECSGEKFGKPSHPGEAVAILKKLSGKRHRVLSGVVLIDAATGRTRRHVEIGLVTFRRLTVREIEDYVATGEPKGKAGAYAVQGLARKRLIESVEGEEEAIIGLPLRVLREWLSLPKSRV